MATTKPNPPRPPKPGQSADGRFVKGNKLGKGGEQKSYVHRLKNMIGRDVSPEDIAKIGKKLCTLAKAGNVQAAKELFDRMWGRPQQSLEVDLQGTMNTQAPAPMSDEDKIALCVENGLMHLLPPALRERAEAVKPKALPPEIVGTVEASPAVTKNGHGKR